MLHFSFSIGVLEEPFLFLLGVQNDVLILVAFVLIQHPCLAFDYPTFER